MMIPPGRRRDGSGWPFIAVALSIMAIFGGLSGVSSRMGPASIPIWFAVIGGLAFASRGPIGKALAARIHASALEPGDQDLVVPPELYAELDELRARVAELEERQDFSERLLAQRNGTEMPPA